MTGDVKKLSNKAPIILTWVPRVHGTSLPDGKNSDLNYLDIIKNHKLINKEERDIYLVINGPGFEQSQIDDLKHKLKEVKGVHVIDLHQYNWGKIDQGWKIDGRDISIKDFFRDMYNMEEKERMYFAVEIDTLRLIALALVKQFAKQGSAIYIDFDALAAINVHIGKNITIPKDILLGYVGVSYDSSKKKVIETRLNNDLIAISNQDVAVDILSEYKAKILSQKEMCDELVRFVPFFREKLARSKEFYSSILKIIDNQLERALILKESIDNLEVAIESGEIGDAAVTICKKNFDGSVRDWIECVKLEKANGKMEDVIKKLNETKHEYIRNLSEIKLQEECLAKFSDNPTIKGLYEADVVAHINDPSKSLNSGHCATLSKVDGELMGSSEQNKWKLFSFPEKNGNYVNVKDSSDLSWAREDLYCKQQVSGKLEEAKVGRVAMEKLSLV
ncbi:hypothetical protein [Wolbachia endosymbiont (group B) of Gerris lacustris]|uniref:hypothetical protein n=1 Tax=Wolbachia endosymbiont (group B) of Gerris lacustris TaxID=3066159 RepID=UPI00334178F5